MKNTTKNYVNKLVNYAAEWNKRMMETNEAFFAVICLCKRNACLNKAFELQNIDRHFEDDFKTLLTKSNGFIDDEKKIANNWLNKFYYKSFSNEDMYWINYLNIVANR